MQTEDESRGGPPAARAEVLPPRPGPIDRAIGIVEDAGTALGFAKRIYEAAAAIFGSKTPVRDILDDAGARAERARSAPPGKRTS